MSEGIVVFRLNESPRGVGLCWVNSSTIMGRCGAAAARDSVENA